MTAFDNMNLPEYDTEAKTIAAPVNRFAKARAEGEARRAQQETRLVTTEQPAPKAYAYEPRTIASTKSKTEEAIGTSGYKKVDPAKLSDKQKMVVRKFGRKYQATYADLAPYINLIFAVYSGNITLERFQKLSGVELTISTFDDFSAHNE